MRWIGVVVIAIAACTSPGAAPTPDGGGPVADAPAGCPSPPAASGFDFYGEACRADPFPANTVCHDDHGWCIDGACRPMADANGCPVCPDGTERFSPAGGAYCQPPAAR